MSKISALWSETVKRFPYIVGVFIILAGTSLVLSYRNTAHSARDAASAAQTAKQNSIDNQKLLERIADLSKQNVELAKLNNSYARCLFTTLAPLQPFNVKDLDECDVVIASLNISKPAPATTSTSPQPSSASSPSSQTSTPSQPSQPTEPAPSVPMQVIQSITNLINDLTSRF